MAVVPSVGSHCTINLPNATVIALNPGNTSALFRLADDGSGNTFEFWLPLNDPRIQVTQALPANWPPVEGDVWSVTGQPTVEAFVVSDGQGHLFFVQAQDVRNAYSGNTTPPITTDAALAQFGTALVLLYRKA